MVLEATDKSMIRHKQEHRSQTHPVEGDPPLKKHSKWHEYDKSCWAFGSFVDYFDTFSTITGETFSLLFYLKQNKGASNNIAILHKSKFLMNMRKNKLV